MAVATPEQKAMLRAAKHGDMDAIAALLDGNSGLLDARDTDGSTPLHCAVWKGHVDAVRLLLDAGADVHALNHNDHWGDTSLHAAAHSNNRECVELLIRHGADVNAQDAAGRTPLFHTTFHKAGAAARVLREHGAIESIE